MIRENFGGKILNQKKIINIQNQIRLISNYLLILQYQIKQKTNKNRNTKRSKRVYRHTKVFSIYQDSKPAELHFEDLGYQLLKDIKTFNEPIVILDSFI